MCRLVAINVIGLVAILLLIEVAVRVVVFSLRGSSTAGQRERTRNLHYQPFVMFGPDWDANLPAARNDRSPRTPTVLLVGGSTAAYFPTDILARALDRRFPGRSTRVINGAFGGYVARQEVVVASLWGPPLRPDLVISLDGANDIDHRLRVDRAGTFVLDATYRALLTRPLAGPFVYLLTESQAYNALVRAMARRRLGGWEQYRDAIPVYVAAQHSLNVLAAGMGAARLMALQPFVGFKPALSPQEAAFTAYRYREPVVKALFELANRELAALAQRDGVSYLDARLTFAAVTETIFSDDVHFRDARGYEMLAAAIAQALPGDTFERRVLPAGDHSRTAR